MPDLVYFVPEFCLGTNPRILLDTHRNRDKETVVKSDHIVLFPLQCLWIYITTLSYTNTSLVSWKKFTESLYFLSSFAKSTDCLFMTHLTGRKVEKGVKDEANADDFVSSIIYPVL